LQHTEAVVALLEAADIEDAKAGLLAQD